MAFSVAQWNVSFRVYNIVLSLANRDRTRAMEYRPWHDMRVFHGPIIHHYNDVIMSAMASQITSITIVYSCVYSGADQRKHQSSASPAFVGGIHRSPVNSPHKGPATGKMLPFDEVMLCFFQLHVIRQQWKNAIHFLSSPKSQLSRFKR